MLNSRKRIIQSTFILVIHYGDIYMNAAAIELKPLEAVYHNALRFITAERFSTHFENVGQLMHCTLFIFIYFYFTFI